MKAVCVLCPSPSPLAEMAEACLYWTPQITLSHEAIFLEIGKCRRLFTENALLAGLQELLESFCIHAALAVGEDLPTALAFARYRCSTKPALPVDAIADYWNPFQPDRTTERMVDALKQLGIRTIGSFLKLPATVWASRFGTMGLVIAQRVRDASSIPWPPFAIQEYIVETVDIDEANAVQSLEPLLFLLKRLIDRVMVRLQGRAERISSVELVLKQEAYSIVRKPERMWIVDFPLPQSNPQTVLAILQERLDGGIRRRPLDSPVVCISLKVLETSPWQGSQTDLFSRKEEEREAWASLIARITERVGDGASFFASPVARYRPENAWQKTMDAPAIMKLPFPKRPLRLLKQPQRLNAVGTYLVCGTKRWKIIRTDGPEHLCGEWWIDYFNRDYYRMTAHTGEQLWVFQIPGSEDFYLHGYFD